MIEGDLRTVRAAPPAAPPRPGAGRMREEAPRAPMPSQTFAPPPYAAVRDAAFAPQPKPELPNPAALQASYQEHFAAAPREFHAAQPARAGCPADAAARHQRNPGAARRAAAHRDRAGIAAGSSARAGHAAGRTHVVAVGADRGFRKRDQRNFRGRQGAGQLVELHRRRAPRRAGRRRRAAANEKAAKAAAKAARKRQGRRQGQGGGRQGRPRTSPPRSARCWSARAWS